MAKKKKEDDPSGPAVIEGKAYEFLKDYLNTPSPTGFEAKDKNAGWSISSLI